MISMGWENEPRMLSLNVGLGIYSRIQYAKKNSNIYNSLNRWGGWGCLPAGYQESLIQPSCAKEQRKYNYSGLIAVKITGTQVIIDLPSYFWDQNWVLYNLNN